MSDTKHIVCPWCSAINRIPAAKITARPACGKCRKALFHQQPVTLNSDNFQKHINKNDIPLVVDFWAPWCGPCKAIGPVVEELAEEYEGKLSIAKMNVDDNPVTPGKFGIRAIPTLILFRGGEVVDQITGAVGKTQLVDLINKAL